ncbi:TonB-dependent receptor [Niveispirillum sp.]|uniref:TonB-dependent receptor domain-containing protein n=1 Tax=Niveispirillum sp. TaxID=1917217 RepID=UPI001B4CDF57|nr:TonB-dependent receptor [Niveispirillum sp.]MBP7339255.1 TonB-dependent receptor [Niveispirillum sp.]
MTHSNNTRVCARSRLLLGVALVSVLVPLGSALAQDAVEEIVVTGSRIARPNDTSTSPVYSVGAAEIDALQQPEVEKIFRMLPVTVPGDGQNTNNGTAGASTVDLRGLGAQRNLVMMDGKRVTPYNFNGLVDVSTIPTALIQRVDIVTGGASAVYGSDAMSGAINFIMKDDFEGVDANYDHSVTGKGDGTIHSADVTVGSNLADGRGNVVLGINYSKRAGVKLGARPLGRLGIETATGAGLADFLAGNAAASAPAGCGGPNSVAAGGSTTTVPTRLAIAGGPGLGQFREDGTLGANCSVFNFNPYNYYQTPLERFGGFASGTYEVNEHAEAYGRFSYSSTKNTQQVAPSGIFGNTFFVPLANPFLSAQARGAILTAANAGRVAGTVSTTGALPNWRDVNGNGVVDQGDDLLLSVRRRTEELGARTTSYDNSSFQFLTGLRGDITDGWSYDLSVQHGESHRTNVSAGYTNVTNLANALNAVSTTACRGGQPGCVPINVFGGYGTITPEMAAYSSATAIDKQDYSQTIVSGSVSGPIEGLKSPLAADSVAVSFGAEYRKEKGSRTPDECWKTQPTSCLGGAGGNFQPISGGFEVKEFFGEALIPLVADQPGFESLDLEAAYRYSDYDPSGVNKTWKLGLNWTPIDAVRLRGSQQRAARAPNVGELASPQIAALQNANLDPCSVGNAAARTDATLRARCAATGMTAAQIGTVEDLVAGQVNVIAGTDLAHLPTPERADTTTLGFVLTPDLGVLKNSFISLDYYNIKIKNVIGAFAPQEILDGCYVLGDASQCAKIVRIGGTLTLPGSGLTALTTNLNYLRAEGLELGVNFNVDLEDMGATADWGTLAFQLNANRYLTQESRSDGILPVLDCLGRFGTSCPGAAGVGGVGSPLPKVRWVQRLSWTVGDLTVGYTWRHLGSVEIEEAQKPTTFDQFEKIKAHNYIDLQAGYQLFEEVRLSAGVTNLFDKNPPVVGNEAGATSANSGNTFPSMYDALGRVFSVGVNVRF